jgi:hypothetical protein
MPISLRHHLPFAAMLACAAVACSERPSPVEPIATALAARNGGAPVPNDPTPYIDQGASEICGFPVQVMLGGKMKELVLPGGRIFSASPGYTLNLTNLTSGRTEHLVATGVVRTATLPDGNLEVVLTGGNLVGFLNTVGIEDSFLFVTGRYSFIIDPAAGAIVEPFHGNGQIIDLCELLASPN